jgi:hypothetical protein
VTVTLYSKKQWHSDSETLREKHSGTVTMTFYSIKIMAKWQWHSTEEKYWNSDNDTLLEKNVGTVTVTVLLQNIGTVTATMTRESYWHNDSDTLHEKKYFHNEWHFIQGRQLISVRTFQVCWSIMEIFVTQALHARDFTNCAFYGRRCHERHTWLEYANKILPRFLHFLSDSYKLRCTRCSRKFV